MFLTKIQVERLPPIFDKMNRNENMRVTSGWYVGAIPHRVVESEEYNTGHARFSGSKVKNLVAKNGCYQYLIIGVE